MPSQPATDAPSGIRDHGLLFQRRERMESVSRLLDNNFRTSVRDNSALFDYGSADIKLATDVPFSRISPAHSIGNLALLQREESRDVEQRVDDTHQRPPVVSSLKLPFSDDLPDVSTNSNILVFIKTDT
jgi:hypothetical protein